MSGAVETVETLKLMRNINAKELEALAYHYHHIGNDELLALAYEQEEEELQRYMDRD